MARKRPPIGRALATSWRKMSPRALLLLALAVVTLAVASLSFERGEPPRPAVGSWDAAEEATLRQILDGEFRTSTDKQGTFGTVVVVRNVTLTRMSTAPDGDWHLRARDATLHGFVMELIPRDQEALGRPDIGVPLAILGVPFCDHGHEDESWHYGTCWEVHPVLGWKREPAGS